MPHSSGGGFHGGGFHGGGGGFHGGSGGHHGSSNYHPLFSYTHFPGAHTYIYYMCGRPHLIYLSGTPRTSLKRTWVSLIAKSILFIVPLLILLFTGIHVPNKLSTNYNTDIVIKADTSVLSDVERIELTKSFTTFLDKTGITPAFIVNDDSSFFYTSDHERKAYREYVTNFRDEKHWLILYQPGNDWWFEGMQGDETDNILHTKVTQKFNKTLYNSLEDGKRIGDALVKSFDKITPHIMDVYYQVDEGGQAFGVIWSVIFLCLIGVDIYSIVNLRRVQNAQAVPEDVKLTLSKCPYCDREYYKGTVKRCPHCGAVLDIDEMFENKDDAKF